MRGSVGLLGILGATALPCTAADGLQGTLALTSDYVHRGISQSNGDAALQASAFYWHPTGVYLGTWVSSIETLSPPYRGDSGTRTGAEVDVVAGFGKRLGDDWVLDLRTVFYWYPDDARQVDYDYAELSVGAAWRERIYASVAYAPRTTWIARTGGTRDRPAVTGELAFQAPLSAWITGTLGVGYREFDAPGTSGYVYGSASLTLQLHHLSLELGQYATDSAGRWLFGEKAAGQRTVLTAMVSF